jgi:hypothetical protein
MLITQNHNPPTPTKKKNRKRKKGTSKLKGKKKVSNSDLVEDFTNKDSFKGAYGCTNFSEHLKANT